MDDGGGCGRGLLVVDDTQIKPWQTPMLKLGIAMQP